ncbi:hypothetical protein OG352_37120 [Streptomyces sp. NBC_01485]|nr:hypothetical protein [Streptomyces sp. NBC_01485]
MATGEWTPDGIGKLVSRLTLEQKAAQLAGLSATDVLTRSDTGPGVEPRRVKELRPHGVGHLSLAWFLGHDADSLRGLLARIQDAVREVSPFGIGALGGPSGAAAHRVRTRRPRGGGDPDPRPGSPWSGSTTPWPTDVAASSPATSPSWPDSPPTRSPARRR